MPPAPGTVLAPGVVQGATLAVSLLMALALLLALAGREFALPEWDLEWLVTLPLPLPTLLASRVIERVVTNASGFVALVPFLSVLAWSCGYRWAAPVLGFAIAVVLLFAVATVQTFADTGLRLSLPPHRLRNAHALVSIASLPVLFAAVSMGLPDYTFMLDIASALPGWVRWSPPGLAVEALASADVGSALLWSGLMVIEIVLFVLGGVWLLGHQLRNGIVSVGVRELVARRPAAERPVLLDWPGPVRCCRRCSGASFNCWRAIEPSWCRHS